MTEIFNGFRMLVVVAVFAISAWIVSQVIPQIEAAAKLPARTQVEYAKAQAESQIVLAESAEKVRALPTFTALDVQAKQSEIENGRIIALAQADSQRMQATAWQTVLVAGMVLAAVVLIGVFVMLILRQTAADRLNQYAIDATVKSGGSVLLPNGHTVQFDGQKETPKLLTGGVAESVELTAREHEKREA